VGNETCVYSGPALNDSWWHTNYVALQPKLPLLLRKLFPAPKPLLKEVDGANLFFYVGPPSIPYAIALLKHRSVTVRRSAAWGLGSLRKQSAAATNAIPSLIDALADPDRMVRFDACGALRDMGPDASMAIPALIRVVADAGTGAVTNALKNIAAGVRSN
jgi:HEAT repeats